jgi:site-specific DNA-methyltransferase (adenine-specific)
MELNKIYQGHVLDVLRTWPDGSVHTIITSPPYWQLRYNCTDEVIWGGNSDCEHEWQDIILPKKRGNEFGDWKRPSRHEADIIPRTTKSCTKCGAWLGELGSEPSFRMYNEHLMMVFSEAHRVLANFGSLFVVVGETFYGTGSGQKNLGKQSYLPRDIVSAQSNPNKFALHELPKTCMTLIPERFVTMMVDELGFICRNKLIWKKPNAIPESQRNRWTIDYEPIYFFTKKPKYWHEQLREPCAESSMKQKGWGPVGGKKYTGFKFSGKNAIKRPYRTMRSVWDIVTTNSRDHHYSTFPSELVERMIQAACPHEVCTKCGNPRYPIYKSILQENGDDTEHKIVAWSRCKCDVPFEPGIACDIFAGSGTTLAVAKALGRRWVGIELNPEYVEKANRRIEAVSVILKENVTNDQTGSGTLDEFLQVKEE